MTITKTDITIHFTLQEVQGLTRLLGGLSKSKYREVGMPKKYDVHVEPLYVKLHDALTIYNDEE